MLEGGTAERVSRLLLPLFAPPPLLAGQRTPMEKWYGLEIGLAHWAEVARCGTESGSISLEYLQFDPD